MVFLTVGRWTRYVSTNGSGPPAFLKLAVWPKPPLRAARCIAAVSAANRPAKFGSATSCKYAAAMTCALWLSRRSVMCGGALLKRKNCIEKQKKASANVKKRPGYVAPVLWAFRPMAGPIKSSAASWSSGGMKPTDKAAAWRNQCRELIAHDQN